MVRVKYLWRIFDSHHQIWDTSFLVCGLNCVWKCSLINIADQNVFYKLISLKYVGLNKLFRKYHVTDNKLLWDQWCSIFCFRTGCLLIGGADFASFFSITNQGSLNSWLRIKKKTSVKVLVKNFKLQTCNSLALFV